MSPNTGIVFNSEMDSFSAPGHVSFYKFPASPANFIEPGKRPMSSMSPTIFTDENDNFILGVGAAGGSKITQASSYVRLSIYITNIIRCFNVHENSVICTIFFRLL